MAVSSKNPVVPGVQGILNTRTSICRLDSVSASSRGKQVRDTKCPNLIKSRHCPHFEADAPQSHRHRPSLSRGVTPHRTQSTPWTLGGGRRGVGLLKLQCISLSENTSKPLNLLNYFFRLSDAPWERRGSSCFFWAKPRRPFLSFLESPNTPGSQFSVY